MNGKVLLLLVGLVAGGAIGWFTKPATVSLQLGPVNIEIDGETSAQGLTGEQWRHIGLFAAAGGLAGLGLGVLVDRRRSI